MHNSRANRQTVAVCQQADRRGLSVGTTVVREGASPFFSRG